MIINEQKKQFLFLTQNHNTETLLSSINLSNNKNYYKITPLKQNSIQHNYYFYEFPKFLETQEAHHRTQEVPFEQILQKATTAIKHLKSEGTLEKKRTLKLKILSNQALLAQQLAEKLVDKAGTATYGKTEVGHYTIDCTYPDIDLHNVSIEECLHQAHQMAIEHESTLQDCELV